MRCRIRPVVVLLVIAGLAAGCGNGIDGDARGATTPTATATAPAPPPVTTVTVTAPAPPAAPAAPIASPPAPARRPVRVVVVGHSVLGRSIRARVVGDPDASRRILFVGCIHGDEPAGEAITRRLRSRTPPKGTVWWIVDEFNPDGCAANTRQNAHKVDLNRNSPWNWQRLTGFEYSGTGPLSEPESVAINRLVRRLRPAVSIWYHQHAALVDTSSGGDRELERRYAKRVGLPLQDYGVKPGSIVTWQNRTFDPRGSAFVVELPAGPLSRDAIARHVAAIRAL